MIQASELRLGNWVDDSMGFFYQIQGWHFEGVNFDVTIPIPLSHDILEKAGFVKTDAINTFMIMDEDCWLRFVGGGFIYLKAYSSNTGELFPIAEILFLHQLQNLYFALTGKELNIQL